MLRFFSTPGNDIEKLRKRIERLTSRGKFEQAIPLQQKVCQQESTDADCWLRLASLASNAKQHQLELAARFEAAKHDRLSAEDWLSIAELAGQIGANEQVLAAKFRAADTFAMTGQADKALSLLEEVLAIDPNHTMARRLSQLLEAKRQREPSQVGLAELAPPGLLDSDTREITVSYVRGNAPPRNPTELALSARIASSSDWDEETSPHWTPEGIDLGTVEDPTPARYVFEPQQWPTIIEKRPLIFVGPVDELPDEISGYLDEIDIPKGGTIISQGTPAQLLYLVEKGSAKISRRRLLNEQLGEIHEGYFFGEIGTLMGLPSTTTITAVDDCQLRILTQSRLTPHLRGPDSVSVLIGKLRSWYLEAVFQICPLSRFDSESWQAEQKFMNWVTFHQGDSLVEQDAPAALYVLLTGYARVLQLRSREERTLGYICPGDLCGEIDPSPVTVRAESTITALKINRSRLDQLTEGARKEFEERTEQCRRAATVQAE